MSSLPYAQFVTTVPPRLSSACLPSRHHPVVSSIAAIPQRPKLLVCAFHSRAFSVSIDDEWGPEPPPGGLVTDTTTGQHGNSVEELKRALIHSLIDKDRGLKASGEDRADIMELITQLEAKNPTPAPTQALSLLNGKWILVYTSFSELFPLLAAGTLPLLEVAEISQSIDSEALTVQNSVIFKSPVASTSFSAKASFVVSSPKCVQIKFEEGIIGTPQLTDSLEIPQDVEVIGNKIDLKPLQGLLKSIQDTTSSIARNISERPPIKFPIRSGNAKKWLLTTFLDEELRISRGDGGSIFVLVKEFSSLFEEL